jgi:hypothetical protein
MVQEVIQIDMIPQTPDVAHARLLVPMAYSCAWVMRFKGNSELTRFLSEQPAEVLRRK